MDDHRSEHKPMTSDAWLDDIGLVTLPPVRESAAGAKVTTAKSAVRTESLAQKMQ